MFLIFTLMFLRIWRIFRKVPPGRQTQCFGDRRRYGLDLDYTEQIFHFGAELTLRQTTPLHMASGHSHCLLRQEHLVHKDSCHKSVVTWLKSTSSTLHRQVTQIDVYGWIEREDGQRRTHRLRTGHIILPSMCHRDNLCQDNLWQLILVTCSGLLLASSEMKEEKQINVP